MTRGVGDRIGTGPWARLVASAVVPDESSPRAERGRALARARAVLELDVAPGVVAARVRGSRGNDYAVSLEAAPLAASTWAAAVREARGNPQLEAAVAGAAQSVRFAHWLEADRHEPLVPASRAIGRRCTCPDHELTATCKHVAATAFAFAHAVDADPSLLLRWRGCEPAEPPASRSGDPWHAGPFPAPRPRRPLPPGAVVKRLGRSGIRVGSVDLGDALEPAYRAFAALATEDAVR